eukprot:12404196-Karenia_brevis.AAC.1
MLNEDPNVKNGYESRIAHWRKSHPDKPKKDFHIQKRCHKEENQQIMQKMRQQKQANSRAKAIMMTMGEQQKPGSLNGHQPTWVKVPMSRVVDRKQAWRPKNHTEGENVHIVMCFKCARPATHIWELKQVACGKKRH